MSTAPLAASAAPSPVSGPTTGGTIVSDLLPQERFTSVSGGFNFTAAAASDGRIYAWGDNQSGQLGRGTISGVAGMAPVRTPAGVTFTEVYSGIEFAFGIGSDGKTYGWGTNDYGQLGDGTTTSTSTPVSVATPPGVAFTRLSVGHTHVLALGSDGNTYAWGANPEGTLGDGTLVSRLTPVRVLVPEGLTFTSIAAGAYHSVALASDGALYSWGWNNFGQLGDGGVAIRRDVPARVDTPAGLTFTSVSSGIQSTVALATDGTVYGWGDNGYGQLGDGSTTNRATPVQAQLPAGSVVTELGMGGYHTAILTADGSMWAWGDNRAGQLGDGLERTGTAVPIRVLVPEGVEFATISLTTDASTALGSDGNVYTWGTGGYGLPVFVPNAPPTLVPGGATTVTEVTFGGTPGTDLTYDGTRWTAQTPPGECGPVNVIVSYTQLGQDYSFTFPNRFTYGSAATIVAQPASATITPGGTFATSISVEGDTTPTIQWQIQNGSTWEDLVGETEGSLTTTPERTSSYRAVVSNCLGSVTSETAEATVQAVAPGSGSTPTSQPTSAHLAATGIEVSPVLIAGAGLLALGLAVSAASLIRRSTRLRR
ncbi:hypothetical protein [Microbacterium sp. SLBN-146]|uniref:RCC1 domain-containing protein n=1 Tax=Microbacterium sp. SLBN-146 TaxID=2768457 RepID=UPI00135B6285|nr:hypothetical protein [Microbacterium sp. SLBN-146]